MSGKVWKTFKIFKNKMKSREKSGNHLSSVSAITKFLYTCYIFLILSLSDSRVQNTLLKTNLMSPQSVALCRFSFYRRIVCDASVVTWKHRTERHQFKFKFALWKISVCVYSKAKVLGFSVTVKFLEL